MNQALYQTVYNNFVERLSYVAHRLPTMRVRDHAGFTSIDSGFPSDTFNVIVASPASATDQLLAQGVGHFTAKRWPMALWYWADPVADQTMQALQAYGLAHTETHVAMAVDLAAAHLLAPLPEGLVMRLVMSGDDLRQYGSVISSLFGAAPEGRQVAAYYNLLSQYPIDHFPALRSYLGIYQGKVIATGHLFLGQDSIGVYDIVTRDEYRRRGIGSAIFAYLLEEARQLSRQYAVLQASPDGIGIYQRAGFTPVGSLHTFENRALLDAD